MPADAKKPVGISRANALLMCLAARCFHHAGPGGTFQVCDDKDTDLMRGNIDEQSFLRYFERISGNELVERTGQQNPLDTFKGEVHWIADVDGDGRLEVLTIGWFERGTIDSRKIWGLFRRAGDGSFVEAVGNPFAGIGLKLLYDFQGFVADRNSDGLPDFLVARFYPEYARPAWSLSQYVTYVITWTQI